MKINNKTIIAIAAIVVGAISCFSQEKYFI